MADVVYAVHTRTCTYLLDDDGICRWVLSPSGMRSEDRCIGAQFVACLDLRASGGLVGELCVGGAALFIRNENGRFMLIRTKAIEHVEYRGHSLPDPSDEPEPLLPAERAVAGVFAAPPPAPLPPSPPSNRVILRESAPPPEPPPPPRAAMPRPAPPPVVVPRPVPPAARAPAPPPAPWSPVGAPPPPARFYPPDAHAAVGQAEQRPRLPFPFPMRPPEPSSLEIDAADLEEVIDDGQIYSTEVTLTMPLYRPR